MLREGCVVKAGLASNLAGGMWLLLRRKSSPFKVVHESEWEKTVVRTFQWECLVLHHPYRASSLFGAAARDVVDLEENWISGCCEEVL